MTKKYMFRTESGSVYHLIDKFGEIFLVRENYGSELRRDSEEIKILNIITFELGSAAIFMLEPLGLGQGTLRITTLVTEIQEIEGD